MKMTTRSVAEIYHELTKYAPDTLHRHPTIDWDHPPVAFKSYATGKRLDLARYLPLAQQPLSERVFADGMTAEERSLAALSHLLYFTNGVTAIIPYPDRPFLMRAAPSAGGLYPTEIYVLSRGYPGLVDGLYNFRIADHTLVGFWEGPAVDRLQELCFDHPALAAADLVVVATGVFHRSAWRYQDRAYRRILLDTGHVLGNLEMMAPWFDRVAVPVGGFADDALDDLLFLDGEEEGAIAVIPLLPRARLTDAIRQAPSALPSAIGTLSSPPPEGRRLHALHEATKIALAARPEGHAEVAAPTPTERFRLSAGETLDAPPIDWQGALGDAIVLRRSTRAYTGDPLERSELAALLDFTYRPDLSPDPRVAADPGYFDLSLLETYLAVHDVTGLEPGCYHYNSARRELRQVRFKSLRDEVQFLCLGQELGGRASAVVFHTTDLSRAIARYGDRAYRYLHLDAGHLGERLNVAAIRLGLGASGIGGFFDDHVNELLGIPESQAVVYITTLGRPAPTQP